MSDWVDTFQGMGRCGAPIFLLGLTKTEVGGRKTHKTHKAEESLRLQVEGTELSRALGQKLGKNWVERRLRRNQSTRVLRT